MTPTDSLCTLLAEMKDNCLPNYMTKRDDLSNPSCIVAYPLLWPMVFI